MAGRLRHGRHLVRRFFSVVTAKALTATETDQVAVWLTPSDDALFWSQDVPDQHHALATAAAVAQRLPGDLEAIRAALFHDVGKIHSRLGPLRRSLATLLVAVRLPLPSRWARYRDHGPLGAVDLERVGAEPLVVEFARLHPAPVPAGMDPVRWATLLDADDD